MRRNQGFTLVEIAIVLVIVGLLIGGVLQGQALISSAKSNSIIKKMQSLQTAYYSFQDRYGAVPGDLANASTIIGGSAANCSRWCGNGRTRLLLSITSLLLASTLAQRQAANSIVFLLAQKRPIILMAVRCS